MDSVYQFFRDANFITLAFTGLLVFYVGIRASQGHPTVERTALWLSGLTFLVYVAAGVSIDGYDPLEWITSYIFRGGFVAAIVLGVFCFIGSFAVRTWHFVAPLPRHFRNKVVANRRRIELELQRQQDAIEQQRKEEQRRREREAADRRAEEYRKLREEAGRQEAIQQRRRIQARADCELCYGLHVNEIADRFPKVIFTSFLHRYMRDDQPAEAVELRGKQLQEIIKEHATAAHPPKKSNSIEELATWYVQEQSRIQSLPIDDEMRDLYLVQLNIRYAELTQNLMEKIEP